MKTTFIKAVGVLLSVTLLASFSVDVQAQDEEDLVIDQPLTWSINSIQIVWSVAQDAIIVQQSKFIYGSDQLKSETFSNEQTAKNSSIVVSSVGAGTKIVAGAGLDTNPLSSFFPVGAKVNSSAYLEGGFNYNQTNRTTDTNKWSESEKNLVSKALASAFEQNSRQSISNQRLVFTVDFVNHTKTTLIFSRDSSNTIPVYCGATHIGDAHLINVNSSISGNGKVIPCQFEMPLNDTGKLQLINNRPIIKIDAGQLVIHSAQDASKRIDDAILESTSVNNYFTVAILSGDRVVEWKIKYNKKNPATLEKALESINEKIRSESNNDYKTLFDIKNRRFVTVCGVSFTEDVNSKWITEIKVFKGKEQQKVNDPDSCLSAVPLRGERYVFQLVSMEVRQLFNKARNGDNEALFELSHKYFCGDGVPMDKEKAIKGYLKAANKGSVRAQDSLGDCYKNGEGVDEDKAEAVKWYRIAAEQGDPKAQCCLGDCYKKGEGVDEDKTEAVNWYCKAAEQGFPAAQYRLGNCYYYNIGVPVDKAKAVEWYQKAAAQGHPLAQMKLGDCYFEGAGVDVDLTEAVKWFRMSAEQGNASAQNALGNCYLEGIGVDVDWTEAVKWYRMSAEQGNNIAQNNLGFCYHNGKGVPQDKTESVKLFRIAAEHGYSMAQNNLGDCYSIGDGVPENKTEAVKWYRKAAEQGYAPAQCNLGDCYFLGDGVPENKTEAVKWFRMAAEQGYAMAQYVLGYCYFGGKGVSENKAEAVKWYRKAAEQGLAVAQHNLGGCYIEGVGVPKNKTEAVKWYRKAADQGYANAQNDLALCYVRGDGVPEDKVEAVKWFRKAAEQGLDLAQYNLGISYEEGVGVSKDKEKAKKWYQKAADQGFQNAVDALKRIDSWW